MEKNIGIIIDRNNDYDYLSSIIDIFLKNGYKIICFHNYTKIENKYKNYSFPKLKYSPFYKKKNVNFIKFEKNNFLKKFNKYNFIQIFSIYFPVYFINESNFDKKTKDKISSKWCTIMSVDIFNLCEKLKFMPKDTSLKLILNSKFYEKGIKKHLKKYDYNSYSYLLNNVKIFIFGLSSKKLIKLNKKEIKRKFKINTNKKILLYLPFPVELARNKGPLSNGFQIQYSAMDITKYKKNNVKNFLYKFCIFLIMLFFNFKYFINYLKNQKENTVFKKIKKLNTFYIISKPRFKHIITDLIISKSDLYLNDKQKYHYPSLLEELISISDIVIGYSSNALIKAASMNVNTLNIKSDLQDWESPQHFKYAGYNNKFYNYKNVIKSISIKEFLINPQVLKKIIKNKNNSFNSYRKIFIGNALTIKNLQRIISYKF